MEGRYNTRSPAVKRLMREAQELSEPTDQYYAQPIEDNLFEWHFTVRGPADSDFQHGIYHGRIILPVDYPMKPPSIIWLTPNGRFETNKKICLSISGHHPESWQPSWSIRTALLAIIGFMPTRPGGAIGSLDYTPEERRTLAKRSQDWKCPICGPINGILLDKPPENASNASQEAKELAAQIQIQEEKPKGECSIMASCAAAATTSTQPATTSAAASTPAQAASAASSQEEVQQPGQTPTNGNQQWSIPTGGPVPVFPPWMGVPPQLGPTRFTASPQTGASAAVSMIPRFPLPPSQQPAGLLPMQFYPPGFVPFMPPPLPGSFPVSPYGMPMPGFPPTMPATTPSTPTSATTPPTPMSANNSSAAPEPAQSSSTSAEASRNNPEAFPASSSGEATKLREASSSNLSQKDVAEDNTARSEADSKHATRTLEEAAGGGNETYVAHKGKTTTCIEKGKKSTANNADLSLCSDGTEHSQPELPIDDIDNSFSDLPPLDLSEAEHNRSHLDRSIGSSVPDLEMRSKTTQQKGGLRHRQSATAAVPTSDGSTTAEARGGEDSTSQAAAGGGGQRIEAASGDTEPRLIRTPTQPPRAFLGARLAHRQALARAAQHRAGVNTSQYDTSFFVMLCLGFVTALILLNRFIDMMDTYTLQ